MEAYKVIESARVERGIPVTELSRRTGIDYQSLWLSLRGERKILASEFVSLCMELELEIGDFAEKGGDGCAG